MSKLTMASFLYVIKSCSIRLILETIFQESSSTSKSKKIFLNFEPNWTTFHYIRKSGYLSQSTKWLKANFSKKPTKNIFLSNGGKIP